MYELGLTELALLVHQMKLRKVTGEHRKEGEARN